MIWRVIFCWLLATTFAHASFLRHPAFSKFPDVHQHLVAAPTVRMIEIANTNSQKVYPASGVQTDPNGLLYMRAKYYNPYISRFINADPSGFGGGLNMYAFCNGNPISLADPFGLGVVDSAYQRSWEDTGDVMLAVLGKMASDLWNNSGTIAAIGAAVLTDGLSVEAEAALEATVTDTALTEETAVGSKALVPYYPPNQGFAGAPDEASLVPGTVVDRYGGTGGSFLSPQGTPPWARSLPFGAETRPLNSYQVMQPINVNAGIAAPWINQPGGGLQFDLGTSIVQDLINRGHLKPLQ